MLFIYSTIMMPGIFSRSWKDIHITRYWYSDTLPDEVELTYKAFLLWIILICLQVLLVLTWQSMC